MKKRHELRNETFCQHYIRYYNGTNAAIAAGYSKKTASAISSNLLRRPDIINRLNELAAEKFKSMDVTKETVLDEIVTVALANMGDFAEWGTKTIKSETTDQEKKVEYFHAFDSSKIDTRCVQQVELGKYGLKIKLYDKGQALNILAKYFKIIEDDPTQSHTGWVRLISDCWRDRTEQKAAKREKKDGGNSPS